jgi:hypothetical protein
MYLYFDYITGHWQESNFMYSDLFTLELLNFMVVSPSVTESHSARHSIHTLQPETHFATTLQNL